MLNYITKTKEMIRRFHSADIYWHDRLFQWTPFHQGFWGKVLRHRAIARIAHVSSSDEYLLDVGCGDKPFKKVFTVENHIGLEHKETVYRENKADLCGDIFDLPIPDDSINTVLCTEVLEHLEYPHQAIDEFHRVLKVGGFLIMTVPFVYPVHDKYDFFRYTPMGLEFMLKDSGFLVSKLEPLAGSGLTFAILLNVYLTDIGFFWTKWLYPIGLIFRPLVLLMTAAINLIGGIFEVVIPSRHHKMSVFSFNHLVLAIKP